ncbi:unnamed protein product [Camellia sinensis]
MKGGGSSSTVPPKRRWKCLVVAVLGLVFLSMLVPLVFLLGLHSGFHSTSAYATEPQTSTSNVLKVFDQHNRANSSNQTKIQTDQSKPVDALISRSMPTLPKFYMPVLDLRITDLFLLVCLGLDSRRNSVKEAENKTIGLTVPTDVPKPRPKANSTGIGVTVEVTEYMKGIIDESEKLCEVKFGSYCIWRQEHKEKMKDDMVKKLKDQLCFARAYYPSIAKLPAQDKLSHAMKQNIQEFE